MGNRNGNKKLRNAVRTRMAKTGESYQKARAQILRLDEPARQASSRSEAADIDLLSIRYFGVPMGLATFEIAGRLAVLAVSSPHRLAPFPPNPLVALGRRTVH
jgi:hypothetical protein